jgi:MFS family permease
MEDGMSEYMHALKVKWQNSSFVHTFNMQEDKAKGRSYILISSILSSIAGQLSGGIFYTGFLLSYGINTVNIGIITFVPALTRLLSMFSPYILERFRKRKGILTVLGMLASAINILGITLLPDLIQTETGRVIGFTCLVTLSSAISAIVDPGYSTWHAQFLPEETRMDYFTLSSCINSFLTSGIVLILSIITDSFAGSPQQLEIITGFRYAALIIAILHFVALAIPKEFPYERSKAKIKISDIIVLPFHNKKFLHTVILIGLYYIGTNLTAASINIFMLQDLGISYTTINLINAVYFLFFIFFGKMWKRLIKQKSWFKTFAIAQFMQGPTYLLYAFVTPGNSAWLWIAIRLIQHVIGVGCNSVLASMVYVNLPNKDQTNYMSFYSIFINLSSFLSMMLGTLFISGMGENTLNFFGFEMSGVPILLLITGISQIIIGFLFVRFNDNLQPENRLEN